MLEIPQIPQFPLLQSLLVAMILHVSDKNLTVNSCIATYLAPFAAVLPHNQL